MTDDELHSTYQKVQRVINSCRTIAQLLVARQYVILFLKHVTVEPKTVAHNLTVRLRRQKMIIRYDSKKKKDNKKSDTDFTSDRGTEEDSSM